MTNVLKLWRWWTSLKIKKSGRSSHSTRELGEEVRAVPLPTVGWEPLESEVHHRELTEAGTTSTFRQMPSSMVIERMGIQSLTQQTWMLRECQAANCRRLHGLLNNSSYGRCRRQSIVLEMHGSAPEEIS